MAAPGGAAEARAAVKVQHYAKTVLEFNRTSAIPARIRPAAFDMLGAPAAESRRIMLDIARGMLGRCGRTGAVLQEFAQRVRHAVSVCIAKQTALTLLAHTSMPEDVFEAALEGSVPAMAIRQASTLQRAADRAGCDSHSTPEVAGSEDVDSVHSVHSVSTPATPNPAEGDGDHTHDITSSPGAICLSALPDCLSEGQRLACLASQEQTSFVQTSVRSPSTPMVVGSNPPSDAFRHADSAQQTASLDDQSRDYASPPA
eukprot:TRINITY_DN8813_c0_g1_i6.p1 TRINITY_DN8813_c0_g1~~TRINITY_DN8813_c0_g1_i6.p1  ORF type:complete len:271 (+),score=19.83 TRINITY_DN8813_c0_g1_i6:42-815(+)